MRHGAKKEYVSPKEGDVSEDIAELRKSLSDIEKWDEFRDERFAALRDAVEHLKKEEITEDEIDALDDLLNYLSTQYDIKSKEFAALRDVVSDLSGGFVVYQDPYMDIVDNGEAVRIHIWGRCETDPPG